MLTRDQAIALTKAIFGVDEDLVHSLMIQFTDPQTAFSITSKNLKETLPQYKKFVSDLVVSPESLILFSIGFESFSLEKKMGLAEVVFSSQNLKDHSIFFALDADNHRMVAMVLGKALSIAYIRVKASILLSQKFSKEPPVISFEVIDPK